MSTKSFQDQIEEALQDDHGVNTGYDRAVSILAEAAEGIGRSLNGLAGAVRVAVEPSFTVNLGQKFDIVIRVPAQGMTDVLFRAYVPVDGFPVTLNLFGERLEECADEDALRAKILAFLQNPNVKSRLRAVKKLLAA